MRRYLKRLLDLIHEKMTGQPGFMRFYAQPKKSASWHDVHWDLVIVSPPAGLPGWILHAICEEVARYYPGRTTLVHSKEAIPPTRAIFYSHGAYFRERLIAQPAVRQARNLVLYTHPSQGAWSKEEFDYVLGEADSILSMSGMFADQLRQQGHSHVVTTILGADPALFKPHQRGSGKVGFCSSYYPRKNGDMILAIINMMPEIEFSFCGRNWQQYERWDELSALPNLTYLEIPYTQYPEFYASIDVLVSVSELEGGPIPLLEAMMANVVPVSSLMGHAPDLITHGDNGYLFSLDASASEVCELIRQALGCAQDVSSTVMVYTWERFSHQVYQIASGDRV